MKKLFAIFFAMLFCSYISYSLPTATIASVTANTGDVITLPVTFNDFNGAAYSPAAITFFINYDNTKLSTPSFTGVNSLLPGWIFNTAGVNTMSGIWTGAEAISVPNGTVLFNMQFTYIGTTAATLTWSPNCEFVNNDLETFTATLVNGTVSPSAPQPPAPPVLATPANGATNQALAGNLTWNASANATTYNVQMAMNSDFNNPIINATGLTTLTQAYSGLTNGTTYYWRASATNAGGTSNWSTVWSFTTLELVIAPTATIASVTATTGDVITLPVTFTGFNGATYSPAAITFFINYDNTKLSTPSFTGVNTLLPGWIFNTAGAGVVSGIWTGAEAIAVPNGTVLFNLQFTYIGTTATTLLWSPNCEFVNNDLETFTATLINGTVTPTAVPPPVAPVLATPVNNATGIATTGVVTWNASANATSYNVQIATDVNFMNLVYTEAGVTTLAFPYAALLNNTTYYWRVAAVNNGGTSDWSTVWAFTTIVAAPEAPVLSAPVNNGTGYSINPILTWGAVANADSYLVLFGTDPEFLNSTPIPVTGTTYPVACAYNTTYYWKIAAVNAGGTTWSLPWSFTTIVEAPAAPILVSPVNNATDVNLTPVLTWQPVVGAESYLVLFGTDPGFLNSTPVPTTNTYFDVNCQYYTQYFWKVAAVNAGGTTWSSTWVFGTMEEPFLPAPILLAPFDGALELPLTVNLDWLEVPEALLYTVQIADNMMFENADSYETNGTQITVENLAYSTLYYWRVQASNLTLTSEWSTVWNFTTMDEPFLPAPVLVAPLDGAIDLPLTVNLDWLEVPEALQYTVQIADNMMFENADSYIVEGTELTVENLAYATTYFWRVQASNITLTSEWSEIWDFTTIDEPTISKVVYLNLFMQGLYNATTGVHQPYAVAVELRQGTDLMTSTVVSRKPAIVGNFGLVTVDFSDVADGSYFLVVRSAGYMALAIPAPVVFTTEGFSWNFTTAATQAVGAEYAQIGINNNWYMRAGDFNSDRIVNSGDLNIFLQSNGKDIQEEVPAP